MKREGQGVLSPQMRQKLATGPPPTAPTEGGTDLLGWESPTRDPRAESRHVHGMASPPMDTGEQTHLLNPQSSGQLRQSRAARPHLRGTPSVRN